MFAPSFNKVFTAICLFGAALAHPLEGALEERNNGATVTSVAGGQVTTVTRGATQYTSGGPVVTVTTSRGPNPNVTTSYGPVVTVTTSRGPVPNVTTSYGPIHTVTSVVASQVCPPFTSSPVTVTSWIPRPTTVTIAARHVTTTVGNDPITVTASGEPSTVTAGGEPITVTAGGEPITVTAGGEPITVTAGGEPVTVTAGNGPVCSCPCGPGVTLTASATTFFPTGTAFPSSVIVSTVTAA